MVLLNCFGDEETTGEVDNMHNQTRNDEEQTLLVVVNGSEKWDYSLDDYCKFSQSLPQQLVVTSMCLVGSFISGHHQELRFRLKKEKQKKTSSEKQQENSLRRRSNNKEEKKQNLEEEYETTLFFLRLSRNNGTDTFQLEDDVPSIYDGDLPTLMEVDTTTFSLGVGENEKKNIPTMMLQDVKDSFDKARHLLKRYDQGDCHSLSQMIFEDLAPGSFPITELDGW